MALPPFTSLARDLIVTSTRVADTVEVVLRTYSPGSVDDSGKRVPTYADGFSEQWLYRNLSAQETSGEQAVLASAEAFAPSHSAVVNADRVKVVAIQGRALNTPIEYAIVGGPQPSDASWRVLLRTVAE